LCFDGWVGVGIMERACIWVRFHLLEEYITTPLQVDDPSKVQ
jgi:hypothetical protein